MKKTFTIILISFFIILFGFTVVIGALDFFASFSALKMLGYSEAGSIGVIIICVLAAVLVFSVCYFIHIRRKK